MPLASWIRNLPLSLKIGPRGLASNNLFLDEKHFRFEVARERMRADRNERALAVLTIQLPTDRSTPRDYQFLSRLLVRRLRITDTIGFVGEGGVGVLLPDTTKSGAWKVADDICSVYPVGHDRPNCDVAVYPDDAHRREGASHRDGVPANDAAPSPIDALLVQPTPSWKRAIDVLGASVGLILSAPLLAMIAVGIKLTSRGPVFYTQEREGLGGRRFRMYKLRTMHIHAERMQSALRKHSEQDGPAFKMTRDPRTTSVGRWLRKFSLDELPQLWNVLKGDMSLVGPRPLPTAESLECLPWQRQRLWVTPGVTCVWQVFGRNTVPFDEWMRMDARYVRQRSLLYDLKLLASTAPALVLSRGPR